MKAKEVMQILRISNPTLSSYVKKGWIKVTSLPNGRYNYDEDSVYEFLNAGVPRKIYIYGRVSSASQKKELETQMSILKQFCFSNGVKVDGVFQDIASGISFENRKDFFKLLDDIIARKVKTVYITYKDRLSRVGFDLFYYLFKKFGTEIVVISEEGSPKLDSEEIFEEIVSLLHCYSMKMYSKRRVAKIKEVLNDESLDK